MLATAGIKRRTCSEDAWHKRVREGDVLAQNMPYYEGTTPMPMMLATANCYCYPSSAPSPCYSSPFQNNTQWEPLASPPQPSRHLASLFSESFVTGEQLQPLTMIPQNGQPVDVSGFSAQPPEGMNFENDANCPYDYDDNVKATVISNQTNSLFSFKLGGHTYSCRGGGFVGSHWTILNEHRAFHDAFWRHSC